MKKSSSLSSKIKIIDEQISSLKREKDALVYQRRQESWIELLGELPHKGMVVEYTPEPWWMAHPSMDGREDVQRMRRSVKYYNPNEVDSLVLEGDGFPSHFSPSLSKRIGLKKIS